MYPTNRYVFTLIITCLQRISGLLSELQRIELCRDLQCNETIEQKVCGVKKSNGEVSYELFDNECLLLQYGCLVDDDSAYGIINMKYCDYLNLQDEAKENCLTNCLAYVKEPVCGIRKDGEGFRIKIFMNQCELSKYNCEQDLKFKVTDFFICDRNYKKRRHSEVTYSDLLKEIRDEALAKAEESNNSKTSTESKHDLKSSKNKDSTEETNNFKTDTTQSDDIKIYTIDAGEMRTSEDITAAPKAKNKTIFKNIVVVGGSRADLLNINRTAQDFFGATHMFDLPLREKNMTERTRRMIIKIFGPAKVFTPWVNIPKEIKDDDLHRPTLRSCYHKCPMKCPDTYAPVCGVPGKAAREPSLMFQNHCFMDVAQCKMFWEGKSGTAKSSAYIESNFVFCLGQELSGLYKFLPIIRTLQHMGRLKKKGHFRMKLRNLRFYSNLLNREGRFMGR